MNIAGANEDSERIANLIRKISPSISQINVTLDSHQYLHIAHAIFWKVCEPVGVGGSGRKLCTLKLQAAVFYIPSPLDGVEAAIHICNGCLPRETVALLTQSHSTFPPYALAAQ